MKPSLNSNIIYKICKLVEDYSIEKVTKFVVKLNLYKLSSGKEYSSDYDAILRWVVNRDGKINNSYNKSNNKYKNFTEREYDSLESYYDNI